MEKNFLFIWIRVLQILVATWLALAREFVSSITVIKAVVSTLWMNAQLKKCFIFP